MVSQETTQRFIEELDSLEDNAGISLARESTSRLGLQPDGRVANPEGDEGSDNKQSDTKSVANSTKSKAK
ncbi:MAG: hypothetical protein HWQ38_24035 [Nostoc sp. NMS7]|uniref:hypothetical protein n=1 Tax=Nostoc sp. NMS7 TaxID=2815391 RepID=UPI0025E9659D|nr:hypothetical protein [Nostoc sp. NMS7]MBN3949363.1 hypothetical protein [Nostoc sp. NMS7]